MKNLTISAAALFFLLTLVGPLNAQDLAVGIRVGSMGPGLEVIGALTPNFNARVGANVFSYEREDIITDLEIRVLADSDLQLGSARALVDFFPLRRGLRVSAGLVYNGNRVTSRITPLEPYTLDEKEFSTQKIGELSATISHKSPIHPYVGFGFGNSVREGKRVGFVFDIGVLYTGSPEVEMTGAGMIAPTANEAQELEQNLEGITMYPLISVGISYKFFGLP